MNRYLLDLVIRYKSRGILIDTNLALLYVVGSWDPFRVGIHNRTEIYTIDDFERLSKFIDSFDVKVVTPNILTETGNLLGRDIELRGVFSGFIQTVNEEFLNSKQVVSSRSFLQLGLTDAGILEASRGKYLVVTDDGPLYGFLRDSRVDVVTLSEIRAI